MNYQNKNNKTVKGCGAAVVMTFFFFANVATLQAAGWAEILTQNTWSAGAAVVDDALRDQMEATQQTLAIQRATELMQSLVTDGSSGPKVITNYSEYLTENPESAGAVIVANTFATSVIGPRTDAIFEPNSDQFTVGPSNTQGYGQYLNEAVRDALGLNPSSVNSAKVSVYENCTGGIQNFFVQPDWQKCWGAILEPQNNPIGITILAQQAVEQEIERLKREAEIKATSSGVISTGTTPAAVTEELLRQQVKLPIEGLIKADSATARTLSERLVIGAVSDIAAGTDGTEIYDKAKKVAMDEIKKQLQELIAKYGPQAETVRLSSADLRGAIEYRGAGKAYPQPPKTGGGNGGPGGGPGGDPGGGPGGDPGTGGDTKDLTSIITLGSNQDGTVALTGGEVELVYLLRFSEGIREESFTCTDIGLERSTANIECVAVEETQPRNNKNFQVRIKATSQGRSIISLPENRVEGLNGQANAASTNTANSITIE